MNMITIYASNVNICFKCKDIIGIKKKEEGCGCECDEEKGFNPEPKQFENGAMCECKEGYVFYGNIEQCIKVIPPTIPDGPTDFMNIPDGIQEELPFK